jgi:putative DNA primase/helicase
MADAFEPLPRSRRAPRKAPAAKPPPSKDGWRVITPVPKIAPPPPTEHFEYGKPSAIYTYKDKAGWEIGYIWRLDLKDGSKEFAPLVYCRHDGDGKPRFEWRWKSWPSPRPLYGLDRLAKYPERPVIVAEGEKAADAAGELLPGHVAVTSPNGALGAGAADWKPLAGRDVVIWPDSNDADGAGAKYADAVKKKLAGIAASVKILPQQEGMKAGWDAADALAESWDPARAAAFIAEADLAALRREVADSGGESGAEGGEEETAAGAKRRERIVDILVGLAMSAGVELWQDQYGNGHATVPIGDHFENWPILSARFKKWLINRHRRASDRSTPASAVNDACANLDAAACENTVYRPQVRVTRVKNTIYVDLGDERWRAIKITSLGWEIIERPPLKFTRSPSTQALPDPEPGGSVDELRNFLPFKRDDDFMLYVAFLIACFQGDQVDQPVLAVYGGEGTLKTTSIKRARQLIDPNEVEIERLPTGKDDIGPQLKDSWLVAYDNVSTISTTVSDMMSETSTGYGNTKKKLYTDEDTHRRFYKRPQAFSAINEAIVRGDLASRAMVITAPPVEKYRRQADINAEFEEARPRILGALLDAVVSALRHSDEEPPSLSRMADFITFIWRARYALGWSGFDFLRAYELNRKTALLTVFEGDSFAFQILTFIQGLAKIARDPGLPAPAEKGPPVERAMKAGVVIWTGNAKALLDQLPATEGDRKQRWWPANENRVRSTLRRAQTALANQGVGMDLDSRSHKHGRLIKLEADIKRLLDGDEDSAGPA